LAVLDGGWEGGQQRRGVRLCSTGPASPRSAALPTWASARAAGPPPAPPRPPPPQPPAW
jgi:hypothetical protein